MSNLIFDFDGTIADTYHLYFGAINSLAKKYGYKPLRNSRELRSKGMKEIIMSDLKISKIKLLFYKNDLIDYIGKNKKEIKIFKRLREVLIRLSVSNRLFIMSSNSKETILETLRNERVSNLFSEIHTNTPLFSKDKVIRKFLKNKGIKENEAFYICDEVRDVEALKKTKVKVVAVTWGYNNEESLRKAKPDFIIKKPEGLVKLSPKP